MLPRSALLASLVLAACGKPAARAGKDAGAPPGPAPLTSVAIDAAPRPQPSAIDLTGLYDGEACLAVRYPDTTIVQSDPARCGERLPPMSTFKIVNALIGADLGLLDGPDAIMRYDGARYPAQADWPEGWGQDQPLRKALEISALPLFQRLAVEIGPERMQTALDVFGYGNRDLSGGIDRFWLDGSLRVSARDQLDLLAALMLDKLAVLPAARATVREALPRETAPDGTVLHFKTGTGPLKDGPWIAWLVGWIDAPQGAIEYACWIKHPPASVDQIRARRLEVCRGALDRLGLFPKPAA